MPPAWWCGCCGGRRAWEDGFDELRATCLRAGDPAAGLRRRGRARRRADRAVDGAQRDPHRGLRLPGERRSAELRAPAALRGRHGAARGLRLRPPGRDPDARRVAEQRATCRAGRWSAWCSTGPTWWPGTPSSSPTCATRSKPAAPTRVAVWCYSLRGDAARPVLDLLAGQGLDVLITTVLATGGSAAGAGIQGGAGGLDGDDWDASALAALDVPIIQAPSSGQSVADWMDDQARPRPLRRHRGHRHPRVRRSHHRPGLRLQRGGRRRRRARQRGAGLPHRARPGRPRRRHRPPLRPAPANADGGAPRGDRAQRLPDQAEPARQRRRPRHTRVRDAAPRRAGGRRLPHRPPPGRTATS